MSRTKGILVMGLVHLSVLLAACGQKGNLYLPSDNARQPTQAPESIGSATAPASRGASSSVP